MNKRIVSFILSLRIFLMLNIYYKGHIVNSFLSFTDEIIFNRRTEVIVTKRLLALIHEISSIRENSTRSLLQSWRYAPFSTSWRPIFVYFVETATRSEFTILVLINCEQIRLGAVHL